LGFEQRLEAVRNQVKEGETVLDGIAAGQIRIGAISAAVTSGHKVIAFG
jgi:hypothetical protein